MAQGSAFDRGRRSCLIAFSALLLAAATMVKFVVEYGRDTEPPAADGRLSGPAFDRNHEPIWSAISGFLLAQSGDVLELGSGTGQHAMEFASRAPHLSWWPS